MSTPEPPPSWPERPCSAWMCRTDGATEAETLETASESERRTFMGPAVARPSGAASTAALRRNGGRPPGPRLRDLEVGGVEHRQHATGAQRHAVRALDVDGLKVHVHRR